ncbi:hypothetical protein HHK36_024650 [Tetracentron sinense]|uniref:Uncharacterized protein n=1 Tax=Tetracentron sinense TaxID=13715 RepID=A0A834YPG4_TETSI|nr:hypothetical protein HHK36_024650 [Tetracentron sinense]
MITEKKVANAIGGKTARACDSCLLKRAGWYCASDDAFLCQGCDVSVHSANPLARRHHRVRLKTSSFKPTDEASVEKSLPAWHQGFTRKARTPRHAKPTVLQPPKADHLFPLVPEIGSDEASLDENEEQLLYTVPIFDPFVAELCTSATPNEAAATANEATPEASVGSELKVLVPVNEHNGTGDVDNLPGFLPSDLDLDEFSFDVESLLGRGLDDDSFGMEGLGLLDCKEELDTMECCFQSGRVKVEEEEEELEDMKAAVAYHVDQELDMSRETLDLNFDCDSPTTVEEEAEEEKVMMMNGIGYKEQEMTRRISLRLDHEAVITAWGSQGCPWTTGDRPQFNPDDCWPDFMGTCPTDVQLGYGDLGGVEGHVMVGDGGREARVSRYREKRRTRLFSKKIRYEVRKLNAEKRPRMKGRFVKRAPFVSSAFPF